MPLLGPDGTPVHRRVVRLTFDFSMPPMPVTDEQLTGYVLDRLQCAVTLAPYCKVHPPEIFPALGDATNGDQASH